MEKEQIRRRLPVKPPEGLVDWTRNNSPEDLGNEYMIWTSERVRVGPHPEELMCGEYKTHSQWAARCTCTICGGDFLTQKVTGAKAVRFFEGEDGSLYEFDPGMTLPEAPDNGWVNDVCDGELFICPGCLGEVELIHSGKLRGGRTKRILTISIQVIDGYMALIYWHVCRTVDEFGLDQTYGMPVDAYVLGENGSLVHYSRIRYGGAFASDTYRKEWVLCRTCEDVYDKPYKDWGSINNKKVGGDLWPEFPELGGTTGEKTGIIEYIRQGGWNLVEYLKLWERYRSIENLCKTGCGGVVAGAIQAAYRFSADSAAEARKYLDLTRKKPHEMLRISREDFRQLRKQGTQLKLEDMELWDTYRKVGGKESFARLMAAKEDFGVGGIRSIIQLLHTYGDADIDKLRRYMNKQQMRPNECGYLLDCRSMAKELTGGRALTYEELWPRNLAGTHDRLNRLQIERQAARDAETREKQRQAFLQRAELLEGLKWTDGELCVVLPMSNEDLVREGKVLRHCVGGYGDAHLSGKDTIFFIRHYRRPERPYYTLDIDLTGRPREKQLHGYGNERHGIHKQYTHRIPQKVRQFCDRWKEEVLLPWYVEQQKQKEANVA